VINWFIFLCMSTFPLFIYGIYTWGYVRGYKKGSSDCVEMFKNTFKN
jgi:hypothetical protein